MLPRMLFYLFLTILIYDHFQKSIQCKDGYCFHSDDFGPFSTTVLLHWWIKVCYLAPMNFALYGSYSHECNSWHIVGALEPL